MSDTFRVLRGVAANIDFAFLNQDGAAVQAVGEVTAGVVRGDGSEVVAAGTATTSPSAGVYRLPMTSTHTADVDLFTVTWTDDGNASERTSIVEIVGGYYLSIAEIRAAKNLGDTAKFSDAELIAARAWFEDKFERATGVAWVRRYARFAVSGFGTDVVFEEFPMALRTVRSIRHYTSIDDYTEYTTDELADLDVEYFGSVRRTYLGTFLKGTRNYVFEIEHGYDSPPEDVKEAALVAIRDKLLSDQTGNRTYSVQTEAGIARNATPGVNTPFGIPFVDEVVAARSHDLPVVA